MLGVFLFLLTIYLVIKRKKSFLGMKPLAPKKLKKNIISLGASFVKLAQVLATRSDFFDAAYLEELKELHDQLPPMKADEYERVFSVAFTPQSFAAFEREPIASASIGQVHIAHLHSGERVAVKLRRESIQSQVNADIRIISSSFVRSSHSRQKTLLKRWLASL